MHRTTLLIPTDFTIGSLNLVKKAMETEPEGVLNILFLHGVSYPDAITDLLFYSKERLVRSLMNKDFREATEVIRQKWFSRLGNISTEIFSGYNQAAFRNFLEANQVNKAYVPTKYKIKMIHSRSFDPVPYILKSGLPLVEVDWTPGSDAPGKSKLPGWFF